MVELRRWFAVLGTGALLLAPAACQQKGGGEQSGQGTSGQRAQSETSPSGTGSSGATATPAPAPAQQQPAASSEQRQASASSQTQQETKTVTGQVVRASAQELVVRQSGGQPELRLKVTADTPVMIGGQQGSITDLKEGTQIRAAYNEAGGEPTATRIEAQQAKPQ